MLAPGAWARLTRLQVVPVNRGQAGLRHGHPPVGRVRYRGIGCTGPSLFRPKDHLTWSFVVNAEAALSRKGFRLIANGLPSVGPFEVPGASGRGGVRCGKPTRGHGHRGVHEVPLEFLDAHANLPLGPVRLTPWITGRAGGSSSSQFPCPVSGPIPGGEASAGLSSSLPLTRSQ